MKRYGMVIDVSRCTGCYACFLACKDENCGEDHPGYTAAQPMTGQFWINITEVERGTFPKVKLSHIPKLCGHCDSPGCMRQARDGAVYKRDDGIVIIDPDKAVGQREIVNACPHRVIFWNEEKQLPQKCDMCAHFLDRGFERPRCVEMCPTGALLFGDLNNPESEISVRVAETRPHPSHPEFALGDNVLYLNIPKRFISGTVIFKETDQCAGKVAVTLKGNGAERSVETDPFGDFWFDDLEAKTAYVVEIAADGYKSITRSARTLSDVNLGEIFLEKAE
jgi:Fe-S-cluster-containing dehydrogenase component